MACPVAGALEAIGDRWALLILRDLWLWAPARFDDLRESSGIPNATLADRLRRLESEGLIEKRAYQDNPLRHDYRLTTKGRDLAPVIMALAQWGLKWEAGAGAPTVRLVDADTGRRVKLALVDAETGAPVALSRTRPRPGPAASAFLREKLKTREARDLT